MQVIEMEGWLREEHYRLFNEMEFPHVNLCVQVDITPLWMKRVQAGTSLTITLAYVITKAANRVPELRQRIRSEQIIEHDVVHPLITVLGEDNIFGVTPLVYHPHFITFARNAEKEIAKAMEKPSMTAFPHAQKFDILRDDLLSMTVLPWLAFTAFSITRRPKFDTIPILGWGKLVDVGGQHLLPFFINFHHALVDGFHIALFVKYIEEEARGLAGSFK